MGRRSNEAVIDPAVINKARRRASRMSDSDIITWAESVGMSLGQDLSSYRQTGDVLFLHEAVVKSDSLRGLVGELIERHLRS